MTYLCVLFLCIFQLISFALPYYVDPEILKEVTVNEQHFSQYPTSNAIRFDLAMSYAYSGQILNGWNMLKELDPDYSQVVIKKYETLFKNNPNEWKYPFKLAFGYFFAKEKLKSIEMFHEVIKIKPDQVWAYGFIGLVYGEMGDADNAIVYCKKGINIEPNATGIHFLLAEAYRKKKKYLKAFNHVLKVGRLQVK